MYKEVLRGIEGVANYPVVGLLIFFVTFSLMLVWVCRLGRDYVTAMARLPLEPDKAPNDCTEGVSPHGGA